MQLIDEAIDRYAHDHTKAPSALFDELREVTHAKMKSPGMQVGRVEGALLRMLVAISGASRILEIGTFTGYSALSMAEALPHDGKLITCDKDPEATGIAKEFFARSPHGKKIEIRLGDALETVKKLREDDAFDLIFIDADKARYVEYYDAVFPHVTQGGLIVGDNTLWSGKVLDPKSEDDHGICRYNDHVTKDPRVDNVLLSVRDGILVARKL